MKIKEHETKPEIKKIKKFDFIYEDEVDGLRRARLNGKWFLIDKEDNKVSKEYDFILDIESDGLRTATLNGKLFLINSKDEKVSKEYDTIYFLEKDGLRWAKLNGKEIWLEVINDAKTRRNIDQEIEDFITSLGDLWEEEPLDGDETEEITKKILYRLDDVNGNKWGVRKW